jgi:hypothetical protein
VTQVGDPLAHGQYRVTYGVRADRPPFLAPSAVADAEHQELAELGFGRRDITEGVGDADFSAVSGPDSEELVLLAPRLGSSGLCGD